MGGSGASPAVLATQERQPARGSLQPEKALQRGGQVLFTLCRHSGAPHLPEAVEITSGSRPLVVGRAVGCDMVLRVQHVSKAHAEFHLQEAADGSCMLMLQDTSSNGTWLNGQKLILRRLVQVQPGDRIAFLPPSAAGDAALEPPTYCLLAGPPAPPLPLAAGPAGRPASPTGRALDIGRWLRSLGAEGLAQYEDLLLATYDDLRQISDLYAEHAEDFFEDVGIENASHQEVFRNALRLLRSAAP